MGAFRIPKDDNKLGFREESEGCGFDSSHLSNDLRHLGADGEQWPKPPFAMPASHTGGSVCTSAALLEFWLRREKSTGSLPKHHSG